MTPKNQIEEQSSTSYVIDTMSSGDGTVIHYKQLGKGPGIIMLHGSMESSGSHRELASALADAFTIYLPDRRGHHAGGSKCYSMEKEVQDLDALLKKTGARYVFGVSSGGLICLQGALTLSSIRKCIVYEPALVLNSQVNSNFLPRYDKEIAEGNIAAALVTAMKGARLGPALFNIIPRRLIEMLTRATMKMEEKKASPGDITMRMLAPTLRYDFQLVAEMANSLDIFRAIKAEVLLLGGSKSPAWLRAALEPLAKTIPHVRRVEFPGLGHGGSSDESTTNSGGNPKLVAKEIRHFLLEKKGSGEV